MSIRPNQVWCSRAPIPQYSDCPPADRMPAPELANGYALTTAEVTLRKLLQSAGLDSNRDGSPEWNPLAEVIPPGSRVALKPNWVSHENRSGGGLDCLITHASVIEAVLAYVAKTLPASVVIGDAPLQGCDFSALDTASGIRSLAERWSGRIPQLAIRDFRRTTLPDGRIGTPKEQTLRGEDDFVLFDLGHESVLEPISSYAKRFRVTMYDPEALGRTHAPGRHQYLVAREVIEADVVINLPKLKTHKKAGLTGALKNMVGINGLKDYLPHHRKGGSLEGGDCYEGRSRLKRLAEHALDVANRANAGYRAQIPARLARLATAAGRLCGHDTNLEGSWYGNDTIWRTTLDLQRVLRYGCRDGRLASTPQRQVITITDAIIAGEGEGPLAPTPVPLGMLTLGANPAAVEWVHALLMGFDPARIPSTREAFRPHRLPLADFLPHDLDVHVDGVAIDPTELPLLYGRPFCPPQGWRGHCEWSPAEVQRCSA